MNLGAVAALSGIDRRQFTPCCIIASPRCQWAPLCLFEQRLLIELPQKACLLEVVMPRCRNEDDQELVLEIKVSIIDLMSPLRDSSTLKTRRRIRSTLNVVVSREDSKNIVERQPNNEKQTRDKDGLTPLRLDPTGC